MENNNSFVDDILSKWNLKANSIDEYIDAYNDKNLIVDIYPYTINDLDKCWQMEIFYRKFRDKEISRNVYLNHEEKYLNFIKYLWLYNSTDIFYDLRFDNYFRKGLKKYSPLKKSKQISDKTENIESWPKLEELVVLALREAGSIVLYFKNWNIMGMINGFSILVLCKEKETVKIV